MKLVTVSVVLSLLAPLLSFANEYPTPEEVYLGICHPNSAYVQNSSLEEQKQMKESRGPFFAFLANPQATVDALKNSSLLKKDAGLEALGPIFLYAATCSAAETIHDYVAQTGCSDESGKSYGTSEAVRLCYPISEALKKLNE